MAANNLDHAGYSLGYRPDVDGLRAVAVLSVVAYHISGQALPGGFLGVDIFFVISGYLIGAIIWREVLEGSFSIVAFYDRRIRRIMPALLALLIAASVAAVIILLPTDLQGYGKSLLATLAFAANIYFWRDTNYFSRAAEEKPLLHLWSLGVEEQFYIFFPLLLALIAKFCRHRVTIIVALLLLVSLAMNVFALRVGGASPAFFLLPTRVWELSAGALLAVMSPQWRIRRSLCEVAAGLGAILMASGLMGIHPLGENYPAALGTVLGAFLVLGAGQHQRTRIGRLLSTKPMVATGLVSYSLYLWHWPIIVFSQYYLVRKLSGGEALAACVLMALAAYLSWRYVERPFRSRHTSIGTIRVWATGLVVVLAGAGAAIWIFQGFPERLDEKSATINQAVGSNYRCAVSDYIALGASRACPLNLPSKQASEANVVLLGNSHAQMYAPVWADIFRERGWQGLLLPMNGCLPTTAVNLSSSCLATAKEAWSQVARLPGVGTVVIGMNWHHEGKTLVDAMGTPVLNTRQRVLQGALDQLVQGLVQQGKRVVLIGPIAEPGWDVASETSRRLAFGHPLDKPVYIAKTDFDRDFSGLIGHFSNRQDLGFARPDKVQCGDSRCEFFLDGRSLFADSDHLSVQELFRFKEVFQAALPP